MTGPGRAFWLGRAAVALVVAAATNSALSLLRLQHDPVLVTLLAVAVVAAIGLAVQAAEVATPSPWSTPPPAVRPETGEDTRTATFRHLVEVHHSSRDPDDAVLWQLADLAAQRMRQVHDLRYADDPVRATELLGPLLAGWVAVEGRDRHHRGDAPPVRYTREQLGEVLARIEGL